MLTDEVSKDQGEVHDAEELQKESQAKCEQRREDKRFEEIQKINKENDDAQRHCTAGVQGS